MSGPRKDGAPPCTPEQPASLYYTLWDPQSVKADERISDVVTGLTVDKTSCYVEYRLELVDQVP